MDIKNEGLWLNYKNVQRYKEIKISWRERKKEKRFTPYGIMVVLRRSVNTCKCKYILNLNLEIYSVKNYGHFK